MRFIACLSVTTIIPIVLLGAGCESASLKASEGKNSSDKPVPVALVESEFRPFAHLVVIQGVLRAERKATISPEVPGQVRKIYKQEGDAVHRGEKLVVISQSDFRLGTESSEAQVNAAKAGLVQAHSNYDNLKTQYDRFKKLYDDKAIPKSEFEKIENGYKAAEAGLNASQAQLTMARTGLSAAKSKLADTIIRSPFNGFVVRRMMDEGEVARAMPPSVVMVIMDIDPLKVEGSINEFDAVKIKAGTPARVRVDAMPNEEFEGEVEMVNPMVDPQTRTAKIRVNLPNPNHRLKPGMTSSIKIQLDRTESLAVPDDTVLRTDIANKKGVVFTVADNVAHRREVVFGMRDGDLIEIKSGLKRNDSVVRGGQEALHDGQRVLVVEGEKGEDK